MTYSSSWRVLATFAATAIASRVTARAPIDAIQQRSFLCPVVCDDTWCCLTGQRCQESNGEDEAPFECDDPLFDTTESAFALGVLSSQVESILTENSAFISSLTEALSLTLSFSEITTLPGPTGQTVAPPPRETSTVLPVTTEEEVATSSIEVVDTTSAKETLEASSEPTQEPKSTQEVEPTTRSTTEGTQTDSSSATTAPIITTTTDSTSEGHGPTTTATEDAAGALCFSYWHHVIAAGIGGLLYV